LFAVGAAVVGVVGAAVVGVVGLAVVGVVLALAVVGVLPAAVVVVVEGAVVVVVLALFLWVVVVVVLLLALGELDPHAAATRPPARTMVPMSHRFPVRRDTGPVSSGVTRVNTYCSSPRRRRRRTSGAAFSVDHSYRVNLNGNRQTGKLRVSRG